MNVLDNEGLEYYNERLLAYLKSLPTQSAGVTTFNGREGDIMPENGDYTASMVGAVPTTRTINGKALSDNITLSASDVSAVPTTRTINSKALSSNITLSASDVSAVPTTRTINGKALSSNITLSASDVGAETISTPVSIANGGTAGTTASSAICNLLTPLTSRAASSLKTYASSTYLGAYYSTTGYKVSITNLLSLIGSSGYSKIGATSYTGTYTYDWSITVPVAISTAGLFFIIGGDYAAADSSIGVDRYYAYSGLGTFNKTIAATLTGNLQTFSGSSAQGGNVYADQYEITVNTSSVVIRFPKRATMNMLNNTDILYQCIVIGY